MTHLKSYFVHPLAVVEEGAVIGEGSKVWHHAHVRDGATVGAYCVIGKNVFIDAGAIVGDRVKVQNNVSVYSGVTLGDEVFVGPSAVFTNDRYPRSNGSDWELVPTMVERGASVGANATVLCGVRIGAWAVVGAGAVATHDVEDHRLVVGNPARPVGWVCDCGRVVSREKNRPTDLRCAVCGGSVL